MRERKSNRVSHWREQRGKELLRGWSRRSGGSDRETWRGRKKPLQVCYWSLYRRQPSLRRTRRKSPKGDHYQWTPVSEDIRRETWLDVKAEALVYARSAVFSQGIGCKSIDAAKIPESAEDCNRLPLKKKSKSPSTQARDEHSSSLLIRFKPCLWINNITVCCIFVATWEYLGFIVSRNEEWRSVILQVHCLSRGSWSQSQLKSGARRGTLWTERQSITGR